MDIEKYFDNHSVVEIRTSDEILTGIITKLLSEKVKVNPDITVVKNTKFEMVSTENMQNWEKANTGDKKREFLRTIEIKNVTEIRYVNQ